MPNHVNAKSNLFAVSHVGSCEFQFPLTMVGFFELTDVPRNIVWVTQGHPTETYSFLVKCLEHIALLVYWHIILPSTQPPPPQLALDTLPKLGPSWRGTFPGQTVITHSCHLFFPLSHSLDWMFTIMACYH